MTVCDPDLNVRSGGPLEVRWRGRWCSSDCCY